MYKTIFLFVAASLIAGSLISCSSTSTGNDPEPEPEPEITTGSVKITASTTGNGTDGDGYTVTLNNESKSLGVNGTVTFEDIEAGAYSAELSGLGKGCSVEGDNPLTVNIVAKQTASAAFQIRCTASTAKGIIAFAQTANQQLEIFTMKADGTGQQQLTNYDMQDQYPAISPDGKRIVFTRQEDADGPTTDNEIWVMDIDGSNLQQLTNNTVDDKRPTWSPDGTRIAYESGQTSYSIWVMNADGSNKTQVTDDNGQDHSVSWSAKDDLLAFVSDRQGDSSADIYTVKSDGTGLGILIDANSSNGINLFDPDWSPDGSQIAYQGYLSNGSAVIYIADADGSNAGMIQPDGYSNARQPAWSPDGAYIAFLELSNGTTADAIWIVQTDGSNPVKLTDDQAGKLGFPSWGIVAK